eukprot:16374-Heterococcus_DN1.PRE.1
MSTVSKCSSSSSSKVVMMHVHIVLSDSEQLPSRGKEDCLLSEPDCISAQSTCGLAEGMCMTVIRVNLKAHSRLLTTYSTIFQSKGRLRVAQAADLSTYKSRMPAMLPIMAGQHASIDTLKYARRIGIRWEADELCWGAARSGDLPKLKWLLRRGRLRHPTFDIAESACESRNMDMLRWLRGQDHQFDNGCYHSAVRRGHLHVVTWLHDTLDLQDRWFYTAGTAVRRGDYETLLKLL